MSETPQTRGRAFVELREAVLARAGRDGWARVVAALSREARAAAESTDEDAVHGDDLFAEVLAAADDAVSGGDAELAREVGARRADAIVSADDFGNDPFRFLKEGATRFYEGRANYGAASVELTPKRAVVRLVASEALAKAAGPRGPSLFAGFLERGVEIVSGTTQTARYVGSAPRIDARFDRPMMNLLFEFEVEE